jgi:hypothetical protein
MAGFACLFGFYLQTLWALAKSYFDTPAQQHTLFDRAFEVCPQILPQNCR